MLTIGTLLLANQAPSVQQQTRLSMSRVAAPQQQQPTGDELRLRGGHCQVPCGIFDDPKLVAEINEACATIRKAIVQV